MRALGDGRGRALPGQAGSAADLLPDVDLNLLRVFALVYRHRNVTEAAARLGLTQSAASNALARLRRRFADPLFVRAPQGVTPTPYCDRLAPAVLGALSSLADAVTSDRPFDPSSTQRRFVLRMSDIGEIVFLPALLERLAVAAPGASLRTVSMSSGDAAEALARGDVDLAIGFLPGLRDGWFQQRLFEQRYVCLMREGHPLAGRRLTRERFLAADHLLIEAPGTGHSVVDEHFERIGAPRRSRLAVPDFLAAVLLCSRSELLCTVPLRLAQAAAQLASVTWTEHPFDIPGFGILQYWHARAHRDPAHLWLRTQVASLFADGAEAGQPIQSRTRRVRAPTATSRKGERTT